MFSWQEINILAPQKIISMCLADYFFFNCVVQMSIYIWLRFRRFFFEMTLKNRFSFNFSPLIIFLNQALVVMNYFMITGVWWKRFLVPLMPSDKDFGTLNKRVNLSYSLRERNTKYTGINNAYIFQFVICLWIFLNLKMVEIIISQFKTNILNFSVTALSQLGFDYLKRDFDCV